MQNIDGNQIQRIPENPVPPIQEADYCDSGIIRGNSFVAVKSLISEEIINEYKLIDTNDLVIPVYPSEELIRFIEKSIEKDTGILFICGNTIYKYNNLKSFIRCYGSYYNIRKDKLHVIISFSYFYNQKELSKYLKSWNGLFFTILHQRSCLNFLAEFDIINGKIKQPFLFNP